eukprot:8123076-Pyramimonas_sp.AAC.1
MSSAMVQCNLHSSSSLFRNNTTPLRTIQNSNPKEDCNTERHLFCKLAATVPLGTECACPQVRCPSP